MSSSTASPTSRPSGPPGLADVDASFRAVALCFVVKAMIWLVVALFILLLASVKLHAPGMMSKAAWLTYGRLAPAGWNVLVYGFAGQAAFAVGLWLLARAGMQRLQFPKVVLAGGAFWNLGVLTGLVGVLAGFSTGRELLEFPAGSMTCLLMGAGLIGSAGWMTHAARTRSDVYPGAWFILLALISFVWFGTVALAMFCGEGPRGVIQVLVQRWYANGVLRLWLGGLALGFLLHSIPLLTRRPLASRSLTFIAFWSIAFFTPWAVTQVGDPFPRWIVAAGLAGQFLSGIALLSLFLNLFKTTEGAVGTLWSTLQGRLAGIATISYLLAELLSFSLSFQNVSASLRFTWIHPAIDWLIVGGALSLGVFALLPEFISRTTGRALPAGAVTLHGMLSIAGLILIALPFLLGGVSQGIRFGDTSLSALDVVRASMMWIRLSSLGLIVFLSGQVILLGALGGLIRSLVAEGLGIVKSWSLTEPNSRTAGVRS